jgi:hypothetical protein
MTESLACVISAGAIGRSQFTAEAGKRRQPPTLVPIEDLPVPRRAGALKTRRPHLPERPPGDRHRGLSPNLGVIPGAYRRRAEAVAPEAGPDTPGMS